MPASLGLPLWRLMERIVAVLGESWLVSYGSISSHYEKTVFRKDS